MPGTAATAGIAIVFLAACAAAHADSVSEASITDLRIQLIDLAPGDGIAPSVTFIGQSGARYDAHADGFSFAGTDTGATPFAAVSTGSSASSWSASALFSGDPLTTGGNGSTTATTKLVAWNASSSASFGLNEADQTHHFTFTLSPQTEMLVTGEGHVSDTVSDVDIEFASSVLHLLAATVDSNGIPNGGSESILLGDAGNSVRYDPVCGCFPPPVPSVEKDAQMTVTFSNATDADAGGLFELAVSANAASNPLTVPEPDGRLLLLAGFGAVALAGRRQRG